MRQISIKELRQNISKEMDNLPFEVTKRAKVIGVMCTLGKPKSFKCTLKKKEPVIKCTPAKKSTDKKAWINPVANSILAPKKGME